MDEVGRGTTVDDGLAIAFAAVHHLLTMNGCRAMFATHFHELADMLGYDAETKKGQGPFSDVAFFCTDVDEVEVRCEFDDAGMDALRCSTSSRTQGGYFAYSHRLKPGLNRDSHGLKVAQIAGMPDSAVEVARSALSWLKSRAADQGGRRADLRALGQALSLRTISSE